MPTAQLAKQARVWVDDVGFRFSKVLQIVIWTNHGSTLFI
jgi:hypothetical protein